MKKKLNFFCVLMLVLIAAQFIVSFVYLSGDMGQAFREGWQDGQSSGQANAAPAIDGVRAIICLIAGIGNICSIVAFIRFILNVNRDKVFVWKNVSLLRWSGCGLLLYWIGEIAIRLLEQESFSQTFLDNGDRICTCVFYLIMAEAFAIGLKLKEEQDLTI